MVVSIGVDGNPAYCGRLDLVRRAWKRVGFTARIVGVGTGYPADVDEVLQLDARIPSQRAAQMARWLIAPTLDADVVMLSDADMVPLSPDAFKSALDRYRPQSLLALGGDAYNVGNFFQVCYLAASPVAWHQIINPHGWSISDWLTRWLPTGALTGAGFEDEALLKLLIDAWGGHVGILPRHTWTRGPCGGRVERNACMSVTRKDLERDKMIDAHLPRGDAPIIGIEELVGV